MTKHSSNSQNSKFHKLPKFHKFSKQNTSSIDVFFYKNIPIKINKKK